ncbi:MAG TPA: exodeoxyribonuclease VII large subunit [Clostridia bacterium]|nr:exodeoxyribonuclease VII large subunit [Clostridia bacterium]
MLFRAEPVKCWQVSELNNYLKELLSSNPFLSNLWIKGEISNLRQPGSGHLFFTLKDRTGSIRAVMFRSKAVELRVPLRDGMEVLIRASLSIYERDGVYQLYVEEVHPLGVGDLHRAFEMLKAQLEKEGLFRPERKKKLPYLPRRIGLVTSTTGAAIRDILTVLLQRCPSLDIVVAPALVQGAGAPDSIAHALALLNRFGQVDVIIVARGGGSLEELWAFNTEQVARSIAASTIPVVTGVGHETDFTIADLVADRRAPTPTAAAALVVPDLREELDKLDVKLKRAHRSLVSLLTKKQQHLHGIGKYSILARPEQLFARQKQRLEATQHKLHLIIKQYFQERHNKLGVQWHKLDALSPLKVLQRGFSICRDEQGKIITSAAQVVVGQLLEVKLKEGSLDCRVMGVKESSAQGQPEPNV